MPESATVTLPSSGSLLAIVRVVDLLPVEFGVNTTAMEWLEPAGTANEADIGGETVNCPSGIVTPLMIKTILPVLEIVKV